MTMQTIRLDINSDIFDRVMSFLEILPKNMIRIYSNEHTKIKPTTPNTRNKHRVDEFRILSKHISVIDKNIDILSLDKDINSDIF